MRKFNRIKGQDKPQNVIRLPRIGKIRLGVKKVSTKTGKEYPTETDYFVVPPEVQAKYGPEPKELPVMIPVEDEEMFLRQYYACYGGNQKVKCQGDGEFCARRGEDGVTIMEIPCPSPDNCEYGKKFKCAARIDIMLVLSEINCGSTYQLSTGSVNSDIDIRSGIEMAKHLFGRVSWVPMKIVREEKKIPDPATGKMQTHWPVKLYPVATIQETNQIRQNTKMILDRQKNFVLEEPVIEGIMPDTPMLPMSTAEEEAEEKTSFQGGSTEPPLVQPTEKHPPVRQPDAVLPPEEKKATGKEKNSQTDSTSGTERTTNFEFMKAMSAERKRVGDVAYYKVLKEFKVEHCNQITERKQQVEVFKKLSKIKSPPGPPPGCIGKVMDCEHVLYDENSSPICVLLNNAPCRVPATSEAK